MTKEIYLKNNEELIKTIKNVLTKVTLTDEELSNYIRVELGLNPSTYKKRVQELVCFDLVTDAEGELLFEVYDRLIYIDFYIHNKKTVDNIKSILTKGSLNDKDLYNYVRNELDMTPSTLKAKTDLMVQHNYLSKAELAVIKESYKRIVNYYHTVVEKRTCILPREKYEKKFGNIIDDLKDISKQGQLGDEELYLYCKNKGYNASKLKERIYSLIKYKFLNNNELNALVNVYNRIKRLSESKKVTNLNKVDNKGAKDVRTERALERVENYLLSGETLINYCKANSIKVAEFTKYVSVLEKTAPDVYEEYITYHNKYEDVINNSIRNNINLVIESILNAEMYKYYTFDILDFYNITGIELSEYIRRVKMLGLCDSTGLRTLGTFSNKNNDQKMSNKEIEEYLNNYTELNCDVNEKGELVKGTGIVIKESDKVQILSYLASRNIPITKKTKYAATIKYINGTLFDEDNKKEIIKK